MTAGVVLAGDWPAQRVGCLTGPIPARCEARADALRDYASRIGIMPTAYPMPEVVARRLAWDAPAAAEYPRAVIADAADAAELRPVLAGAVWHAAAGAIITIPGCDCDTPAGHRDTLAAIGRSLLNLERV